MNRRFGTVFLLAALAAAAAQAAGPEGGHHRHSGTGVTSSDDRGPHAGLKIAAGPGSIELLTEDRGLRLYVIEDNSTVGVMRAVGSAVFSVNDGADKTYALTPAGEYLLAKVRIPRLATLEGSVKITVLDKTLEAKVVTDERALRPKAAPTPEATMAPNPAGGMHP